MAGLWERMDSRRRAAHVPWSRLVSVCRGGVRAREPLLWDHVAGASEWPVHPPRASPWTRPQVTFSLSAPSVMLTA